MGLGKCFRQDADWCLRRALGVAEAPIALTGNDLFELCRVAVNPADVLRGNRQRKNLCWDFRVVAENRVIVSVRL